MDGIEPGMVEGATVQGQEAPRAGRVAERLCAGVATVFERVGAGRPYLHLDGYMERFWIFQTRWLSARIHRILRSDHDRDLHDHPWDYATVILRGGYWEVSDAGKRWYGPGSILFRRATHLHRLTLPSGKPTTTLFLHRTKSREWGFRTDAGWVHWRAYTEARGEEAI